MAWCRAGGRLPKGGVEGLKFTHPALTQLVRAQVGEQDLDNLARSSSDSSALS